MGVFDILKRKPAPAEQPRKRGVRVPTMCYSGIYEGVENVTDCGLAMKISTAYRCVDILSKGVAQLPLQVKRNRGGYYAVDAEDRLNYLLSVRPNARFTAFEMMRNTVAQMVTRGMAYQFPVGDIHNPSSIVLITPGCATYDKFTNKVTIQDSVNGIEGTFPAERVLIFRNLSMDGYTGVSTISYASRVLAISANADLQNVNTFKKGGTIRGFVSGNSAGTIGFGAVQDEQLDSVSDNIEEQLGSGKDIFSLPGEMKFNQISLSPADLQTLQSKEFNVYEICRFFGVHPDKVFAQGGGNYKASEMSQVSFLTDTLQPLLRQIELEYETKILTEDDFGRRTIDFNVEPLLQTDLTTQAAYIEKTIQTGVRTVNSWRKYLGQEPVEGGDEPLVSANLLPLRSKKLWGDSESAPQN